MKEIIATLAPKVASLNSFKKWKQRREVPHMYRLPLTELARKDGVELTTADFNWKGQRTNGGGRKPKKRKAA